MPKKCKNLSKNQDGNGDLPTAKDFPSPANPTPEIREVIDSTRAAMATLDARIKKYGGPINFRH